ncbi:MAG: cytochrome P450 [bacterium]|nr:cytochrome P450 [bacterium]
MTTLNFNDMLTRDVMNDPHAYEHKLRAHDPVYWNEKWGGWVLTRYHDIVKVLRDPAGWSSQRIKYLGEEMKPGDEIRFKPIFDVLANWFIFKDQPDHTRIRRLLNPVLTPIALEKYKPRIQQIVHSVIDRIEAGKQYDMVKEFSYLIPLTVILNMLGIPEADKDRDDIKYWSEQIGVLFFIRADEPRRREIACEGINSFVEYLSPLVEERRQRPQDDLISMLTQAEKDGILSRDEVIATVVLLVFGGHETTTNLINNGSLAFIQNPDQWELLKKHPELTDSAVEELLRFDTSVKATVRWAKYDQEVGGKQIKKDQRLLLALTAANRDPEVFKDPDKLDITRNPNPHVSFAHGIHVCVGGPLARMEAGETFRIMAERMELPKLAANVLEYQPAIVSRALNEFPVVWETCPIQHSA